MPDIVGIRFKNCGKIYDFEVNGVEVAKGDAVVVESDLGLSIGTIVVERHAVEGEPKEMKKVVRKASEDDYRQKADNRTLEEEAMAYCIERIMARGLPMSMVCTEVTLDRKRFIFYFTADGRIDFRELVKDLAAKFKTRIEMRQIGVRDAARVVGGIGICGRELCCRTFLTSFEPISIKMAKSQELVLNASKLSGLCGRLMCCLSYEYTDEKIAGTALPAPLEEVTPEAAVVEEPTPPSPVARGVVGRERNRGPRTGRSRPRSAEREVPKEAAPTPSGPPAEREARTGTVSRKDEPQQAKPGGTEGDREDQKKKFFRRRRHRRKGQK